MNMRACLHIRMQFFLLKVARAPWFSWRPQERGGREEELKVLLEAAKILRAQLSFRLRKQGMLESSVSKAAHGELGRSWLL